MLYISVSVQLSSVTQSCPTLCNPMDCSRPGFPIHHQLPDIAQTHVYCGVDTNLTIAERPRLWGQGLYRSTPLLKNLRVCADFPSSLVSAGSPRDITLNSGRLAQSCFWHFVGQRALEHLLGWEREGYANCTLVAAEAAKKWGGHLTAL